MRTIKSEFAYTDVNGVEWYRCVIVSEEKPESLPTNGADVDGIPDEVGIAAGSVMLTPDGNEIYYSDDAVLTPPGAGFGVTVANTTDFTGHIGLFENAEAPGSPIMGKDFSTGETVSFVANAGNVVAIECQADSANYSISYTGNAEPLEGASGVYILHGTTSFTISAGGK